MSKKYKRINVNANTGEIVEQKSIDMGFFFDEEDALRHARRKSDWHATKGKRKIKGDYKHDLWI